MRVAPLPAVPGVETTDDKAGESKSFSRPGVNASPALGVNASSGFRGGGKSGMRRAGLAVRREESVWIELGDGDMKLREGEEGVVGSTMRDARGVSSALLVRTGDHDAEAKRDGTGENEENEVNDVDDDEPGVKGSGTVVIAQLSSSSPQSVFVNSKVTLSLIHI